MHVLSRFNIKICALSSHTAVCVSQRPIPDDEEGKQHLCQKLQKFDASIAAYDTAIHEPEDPVSM